MDNSRTPEGAVWIITLLREIREALDVEDNAQILLKLTVWKRELEFLRKLEDLSQIDGRITALEAEVASLRNQVEG